MQKKSFLLVLALFSTAAQAEIDFGSQSSKVHVADGAELTTGSSAVTIAGSVQHDSSGAITGTPLEFVKGILIRDGKTAVLTGAYDADAGPSILLDGDDTIEARDGFILDTLAISGTGNTIVGEPVLSEELVLPSGTGLALQLTQPLNKSITLAGGTITLNRDLRCLSEVEIKGSGIVTAGNHSLYLANKYSNSLASTLTWQGIQSLVLGGRVALNSEWTFTGTNSIEGRGQVLELESSGKLIIGADSTLELRNLSLRGLTNARIVFTNANSTLKLDGCTLHLNGHMTTTSGKVVVVNDSTFVHKQYDWNFTTDGSLTVDGSTLFLNNLSNVAEATLGTVKAPGAVYVSHEKKTDVIASNITAGNLVTPNLGVLTEVAERVVDGVTVVEVSEAPSLTKSSLMGPDDVIAIAEDEVIDGKGSRTFFGRTGTPQLTVAAGKTLTLKNIEFHGVTDTTIDLAAGATLKIAENVIFTLADDVTWNTEELEVLDDVVFQVRGSGKQRRLKLEADSTGERPHEIEYEKNLNIGTGSVVLQNVALSGTEHIAYTSKMVSGKEVFGSLVLGGSASIDIERSIVDLHLVVNGQNNRIQVLRNDATLMGSLTFDAYAISDVSVRFALPKTYGGTPRLHLVDKYATVSSAHGQARLLFDPSIMKLRNQGAESLVCGENSVLQGNRIEVESFPIKQIDERFTIYAGTQIDSALAAGAIEFDELLLAVMRGFSLGDVPRTNAFALQRDKTFLEWCGLGDTRGVSLPNDTLKAVLKYESAFALPPLAGNVFLRSTQGSTYSNMQISTSDKLNLTLDNGVNVQQALTAMTLKNDDIVNVLGGSLYAPNRISLRADTTIKGKILWDDNAVLVIDFKTAAAPVTVTVTADALLDLGNGGTLIFTGQGTVSFEDGALVDFAEGNGTIIFNDEAKLLLNAGQTVTLRGDGQLECASGARLIIEKGSSLVCGTKMADTITVKAHSSGSIRVGQDLGDESSTDRSYLSFAGSRGTLDCSHFGSIVVSRNGALECNVLRGASHPGKMNEINISMGGSLFIGEGGQYTLGENAGGMGGIDWNMLGGSLSGSGLVVLHGTELAGIAQNTLFSKTGASGESLVRSLVQTVPSFVYSTVFYDLNGVKKLYTKDDVLVTLGVSDVLTGESDAGVVSGYDSVTGRTFFYSTAGVRN